MLLDTALLTVAVLLIVGLLGTIVGWRRRDRRVNGRTVPPATGALPRPLPPMPMPMPPLVAVNLVPMSPSLVPEELLAPGFADTCTDWARQITPIQDDVRRDHFSLSDWSVQTDRVELDPALDPDRLHWALKELDEPRPCTIAP